MKVLWLSFLVLIPVCVVSGQNQLLEKENEILITKIDSITWVTNLNRFVRKNDLRFQQESFDSSGNFISNKDLYILGQYVRYSFANMLQSLCIAIKENDRYKVLFLSHLLPEFTEVKLKDNIRFNGKNILHFEGIFETSWSIMSSDAGIFHQRYSAIFLIDFRSDNIIFKKIFLNYNEEVEDKETFRKGITNDSIDSYSLKTNFSWFHYYYIIGKNRISFYKINTSPKDYFDSYKTPSIDKDYSKKQKTSFYYELKKRKSKWILRE